MAHEGHDMSGETGQLFCLPLSSDESLGAEKIISEAVGMYVSLQPNRQMNGSATPPPGK